MRFRVRFGYEPRWRQAEPSSESGTIPDGYASPTARFLAMAHKMDALLRDGRLRDYEHAAAWLGVSKNRANVISRLVHLAPDVQESILLGDTGASEHRLREVAREPVWEVQRGVRQRGS